MPSSRVVLVRHGQTALNAQDRLRGLADPELDEVGIGQARATAEALRSLGLERVLSSPLQRAVLTATIIADASGISHAVDPAFNDRDYGPWTGHVRAEVIGEWGSVDAAPGVEPRAAVLDRVLPALDRLAAAPSVVAVVTHDAVIRPILEHIQPGIAATVPTASWAVLEHDGTAWSVVSVDNVASA